MSALAIGSAGISLVLIRLGWGGARFLAAAGWALAAASLIMLAVLDGVWGLSVGVVTGSIVAVSLVLQSGWTSQIGKKRVAREAPSVEVPHSWRSFGRRLLVFALVVPVSFGASLWLAFGLNAFFKGDGALNANNVSTALFAQPIVWTLLMSWQMTRSEPRQMVMLPVAAALIGTLLWMAA